MPLPRPVFAAHKPLAIRSVWPLELEEELLELEELELDEELLELEEELLELDEELLELEEELLELDEELLELEEELLELEEELLELPLDSVPPQAANTQVTQMAKSSLCIVLSIIVGYFKCI